MWMHMFHRWIHGNEKNKDHIYSKAVILTSGGFFTQIAEFDPQSYWLNKSEVGLWICISDKLLLQVLCRTSLWELLLCKFSDSPSMMLFTLLITILTNKHCYSHFIQVDTGAPVSRGLNSLPQITQMMWEKKKWILFWYQFFVLLFVCFFFCISSLISDIILILYLIMFYFWRRSFGLHIISFIT